MLQADLDNFKARMETARANWPAGEWINEPDRDEWRHEGFPCLIVRNHGGALCGYVGVSPGHPWYRQHYHDVDASPHGGLTYSDSCQGAICHVPAPGEPDNVWWLGFDCAHSGDLSPGMLALGFRSMEYASYRDINYVRREVNKLAEQAKEARVEHEQKASI